MTQHVMVVDDALPNLRLIGAIVGGLPDIVVHPFTSPLEAYAYAESADIDCFILDYYMPEMDGIELIGRLRANPRFTLVPIILVTAEHEREVRLAALKAGANDFIERPLEPQELRSRLKSLLLLQSARGQLTLHVDQLESSLRDQQRRASAQAERLIALWRIANNADFSEGELLQTILVEGSKALRTGQPYSASLSKLIGDAIVVEAVARHPDVMNSTRDLAALGTQLPLSDTVQSIALSAMATRAWNDVEASIGSRLAAHQRAAGMRSVICTPFQANHTTFFLTFWSQQVADPSFDVEDYTYIELLARFFATHLEKMWQNDRIRYQISHDSLTGLRNRTQFRVDARARYERRSRGAVAIIAIDGFRAINESFGHIVGDGLLVDVGAALEDRAGSDDVVARLAGDTFGVFLPNVDSEHEARAKAGEFMGAFRMAFTSGDSGSRELIPLSATIGVAYSDDATANIDELMSHADTAVFVGKRRGPGTIELFEAGMESEASARTRLTGEIAAALELDQFELHLQPHVDLFSGRVTGAEALIRWQHPTRGLLGPGEFIPFAERNGLIGAISSWVINSTITISERFSHVASEFRIFLNLSALDLADMSVVERFKFAAAAGTDLSRIGVEITETAAMHDVGVTGQIVRMLRSLDVAVAIDDFGTGYSSLSLLKRLPVDIIKIDHSFMAEILTNPHDAAIAETIVAIGTRFGSATLGEGVETPEQMAWLREHGCRFAQGYYISRPIPLAAFEQWLADRVPAGGAFHFAL
jgi:diguanylate cyclase (GGDEF)-like protein